MKKLLIFFVFLLLFVGFFHEIRAITQDLGRHLIMGKIITQNQSIPIINLFSYTYPNYPFINHHWFSEVLFYNIFHFTGFSGLLLFSTSLVLFAFFLLFLSVKKNVHIFAIAATSLLYFSILFERTDLRPEIFSFLFLSVFIVVLYRFRQRYSRWIFLLPLLELFWVNMHIYFIIGIIVIGLFLVDGIIIKGVAEWKGSRQRAVVRTHETRRALEGGKLLTGPRTLIVVFLLSIFTTILNPNGIKGALYPFRVFQNYGYTIEENQTIFFLWTYSQKPTIAFFVLAVILLFLFLLLAYKKIRPIDWLLSITFTVLAALAIRNFPLFVFTTFIPFCASLSTLTENFSRLLARDVSPSQFLLFKQITILILFLALCGQIYTTATTKHVGANVPIGAKNASDFFIENHIEDAIFNNFDIGSYLDYRLYPEKKVFVDGRPEAYPASFFQKEYIPMQQDTVLFEQLAKKYTINSIFFAHTDQTPWASNFLRNITRSSEWKIVYLDDFVIILLKNTQDNQPLLKKFAMKNDSLRITNYQPKDFHSLLQLAHFFSVIDEKQQAIKVFHDLLALNPTFCPALYNLSVLTRDQPGIAVTYSSQFLLHCQ